MLPIMGKTKQGTLSIPTLDGGVNYRDFGETVNDDQLVDALNVREKGGLLQTRHRIKEAEADVDEVLSSSADYAAMKTRIFEDVRTVFADGIFEKEYVFCSTAIYNRASADLSSPKIRSRIYFYFLAADGTKKDVGTFYPGLVNDAYTQVIVKAVMKDNNIYSYVYLFDAISSYSEQSRVLLTDLSQPTLSITELTTFYIPTVFTNGLPSPTEKYSILTGDYLEGYNRINPRAKAVYSTYDYKSAPASSRAIFALPVDMKSFDSAGETITAVITDFNGTVHTHTLTVGPGGQGTEPTGEKADGWEMYVDGQIVYFMNISQTPNVYATTPSAHFVHNNIEITFPISKTTVPYEKAMDVFKMTNYVWFGGAASGISDGTRLFMAGSIDESQKTLIVWSDLNNPLYFPENNYAYVGDRGQRINALARQGEALVILKDHETYMSVYRQSTAPTAENVINQEFFDLATANAYFPMISVNSKIGCDAPDTVRLCNNRLVWASTSDKKVYTLVTNDQFSENTILDVSGMVDSRFADIDKSSKSADFDGLYMLFCGDEVFCMDYQSYGFANLSYYQRYDAEKRIPWWRWHIPHTLSNAAVIGESFVGTYENVMYFDEGQRAIVVPVTMTEEETHDTLAVLPSSISGNVTTESLPVENMIASKKYSFGAQTVYKSIPCVRAEFSSGSSVEESSALIITFTADGKHHDEYQTHIIEGVDEFVNRTIRPRIRAARRFDFVLTYYGVIRVGNIEITYQICGGAK